MSSPTMISKPSAQALSVRSTFGNDTVADGTAFTVERNGQYFLVTNRHVLRARDNFTNRNLDDGGRWPNHLVVWQNEANRLGSWIEATYAIREADGAPKWFVHPNPIVDIAALPIDVEAAFDLIPFDVSEPALLQTEAAAPLAPSSDLFVVGFPFGLTGGGRFGIWSRATVASEPAVLQTIESNPGLPAFFVDGRTREGQSGSPVIAHSASGVVHGSGSLGFSSGETTNFVGIYSGRLRRDSDLGIVWHASAVRAVIDSCVLEPMDQ